MSTLNVRNIPNDLFVRLRVCVAEGGAKNIRAFVIKALEEKLGSKTEAAVPKSVGGKYNQVKRPRATKVEMKDRASRFDGPNAEAEEESKIGQVKFPDDHLL